MRAGATWTGVDGGFAALLHSCRRRAGLTQAELALRARLGVRTIRDLELGRTRRPHRDSVCLLADALALDGEVREVFELASATPWTRAEGLAPPGQLPRDLADFTGRSAQVARLRQLLLEVAPAPVTVVAGTPGVGKTALAVHVAHQLGHCFPGGQLFVDLRGTQPHPVAPFDVLGSLLRALGIPDSLLPEGLDERVALYRTCLAERRALVVLDDAASETQVRPLLPGCPTCASVITSRGRLAGLEGAQALSLCVLDPSEAVRLLERVVMPRRVAGEPEAAGTIVRCCGCLPLAVRIAGARLAGKPHWPLARLAELLVPEETRLDELSVGDLEVRACFRTSYRRLAPEAQRAFRLVVLLEVPDLAAWTIAALAGTSQEHGERLAECLVDAQLLEAAGVDGAGQLRYGMHDLLRVFGRECLELDESDASRNAALGRFLDRCGALAARADRLRSAPPWPGDAFGGREPASDGESFPTRAAASAWLEAERATLVGAALWASSRGAATEPRGLADLLFRVFYSRSLTTRYRPFHEAPPAALRLPAHRDHR